MWAGRGQGTPGVEGAGWGLLEPLPPRKGGLDYGAGSQIARSRQTGSLVPLMGTGVREVGGAPLESGRGRSGR